MKSEQATTIWQPWLLGGFTVPPKSNRIKMEGEEKLQFWYKEMDNNQVKVSVGDKKFKIESNVSVCCVAVEN